MKKETQNEHMLLYVPIPQWMEGEDPDMMIGVKDLYLVHTCGSDFFVKKVKDSYDVYTAEMQLKLQNVTKEEALEHIRQSCEANLVYCYRVNFKSTDEAENSIVFDTNAPEGVFKEVAELISEKKDILPFEKDVVVVFQILVKEVFGYLIQEQTEKVKEVMKSFDIRL